MGGDLLELIILGSGTCVPSLRRAGPAVCLRAGGRTLLVDAAAGTLRQLVRAGVAHDQVDAVLFTHLHPDHVGEFVPFLFAMKYAPGYQREAPVTVLAARGFSAFYGHLQAAFGRWVEPGPGRLEVRELPVSGPAETELGPLRVCSGPTRHTPMSLGYRVETPAGRSVVFSGDTDVSPELVALAAGADIFVCECAAPEGHKVEGHLTPSEAGRMAAEAGVGRLVLTHFYPECDAHDLVTPCARFYDGPILVAEDFLRLAA
ncbi:MBL fold metallo-hydrolase [Dissulfurirhabdus thermomarina]|uniref:MBL fold metallo-hydrolase n=1 Tax=Dissulfurirhabdus thermomarina TaxID=1765737 RepID=A0A6N9TN74_DISTH|nr:ribonuclease Z [Dissulfurirhabdus thermomarina]NDY42741.1 MBL fold metallo-hydrolase [Dissulfurirhabdus thermomarina]NMX22457.1 MBL fold metallo-hydrolase [Dissulfurirhabdus thermomarina]